MSTTLTSGKSDRAERAQTRKWVGNRERAQSLDDYIAEAAKAIEKKRTERTGDPNEEIQFNIRVPQWLRDALWREAGLRNTTLADATKVTIIEGLKYAADQRRQKAA